MGQLAEEDLIGADWGVEGLLAALHVCNCVCTYTQCLVQSALPRCCGLPTGSSPDPPLCPHRASCSLDPGKGRCSPGGFGSAPGVSPRSWAPQRCPCPEGRGGGSIPGRWSHGWSCSQPADSGAWAGLLWLLAVPAARAVVTEVPALTLLPACPRARWELEAPGLFLSRSLVRVVSQPVVILPGRWVVSFRQHSARLLVDSQELMLCNRFLKCALFWERGFQAAGHAGAPGFHRALEQQLDLREGNFCTCSMPGTAGQCFIVFCFHPFVLTWLYNVCKFLALESDLDFRVSFGGV